VGLGWLLRRYREEAGLTQRELQEQLGMRGYQVSETALSMWESGQRLPSDPALFHHLGQCLSLGEDQETALVTACVAELVLRYLEPFMDLKRRQGGESEQLAASLFAPLLDRS
jgi:transcriptional regulator with XRE-family HTH domain